MIFADKPQSIASNFKKIEVNAEDAVSIGTVMICLGVTFLVLIIILDCLTFGKDLPHLKVGLVFRNFFLSTVVLPV